MLTTEVYIGNIPEIYARFARELGEKHWKQRVAALKREIRGNPLLEHLHFQENAITFQLDHLRELQERFSGMTAQAYNDQYHYPAASFAAQVLSVLDASDHVLAERFRRRVHGALKNPAEMRAMRLELKAATHFLHAGCKVSWPEMVLTPGAPGVGVPDLLIEDLGPLGLEVECKSISEEKGRRIGRRQAIEFYWQLKSRHWDRLQRLQGGVVAVLTVRRSLPTAHQDRLALAEAIARHVLHSPPEEYEALGASIRLAEFDPQQLAGIPGGLAPRELRALSEDITHTRNKETVVIGTPSGGALLMAVQSMQDGSPMDSILETLRDSASRQFSGAHPGMFVVGLDGLSAEQLLDVAQQDRNPAAVPTALRIHTSKFLEM